MRVSTRRRISVTCRSGIRLTCPPSSRTSVPSFGISISRSASIRSASPLWRLRRVRCHEARRPGRRPAIRRQSMARQRIAFNEAATALECFIGGVAVPAEIHGQHGETLHQVWAPVRKALLVLRNPACDQRVFVRASLLPSARRSRSQPKAAQPGSRSVVFARRSARRQVPHRRATGPEARRAACRRLNLSDASGKGRFAGIAVQEPTAALAGLKMSRRHGRSWRICPAKCHHCPFFSRAM